MTVRYDFATDPLGELPSYVTLPWTPSVVEVRESTWAANGRALVIEPYGAEGFFAAIFDGAPTDRDVELRARLRESGPSGGSHWLAGLASRIGGTLETRSALAVSIRSPISGSLRIVLARLVNGAHAADYVTYPSVPAERRYRVRFIGSTVYAKVWADGDDEPEDWTVAGFTYPATPDETGAVGLFRFHGSPTTEVDWIEVEGLDEPDPDPDPEPDVRILAAGDSLTAGSTNATAPQATWRLPFVRRLEADDVMPGMVGPYEAHPSGLGYVEQGEWPHRSFAVSGWRAADVRDGIGAALAAHPADVATVLVGTNDLNASTAPATVAERIATAIANARAASPGLDVALCLLPPSNRTGNASIPTLNGLLVDLAATLDEPSQRVVTVDLWTGYDVATDHYDGLHPSPSGETLIADRIADAFATELGIGTPPDPDPGPDPGPSIVDRLVWSDGALRLPGDLT